MYTNNNTPEYRGHNIPIMNSITQQPYSEKYLAVRDAMNAIPAMKPKFAEELRAALASDIVLLSGETGSGKSVIAPYLVWRELGWKDKVVCTQPRTVNASTIAATVAALVADVELGKEVGFRYKHNNRSSSATRLLYVTDGTMLSSCFKNPHFDGISCVMIDEAHERNVNIDLILYFVKQYLTAVNDAKGGGRKDDGRKGDGRKGDGRKDDGRKGDGRKDDGRKDDGRKGGKAAVKSDATADAPSSTSNVAPSTLDVTSSVSTDNASKPVSRVKFVIMSATMQLDPIRQYFKGFSVSELSVEGRTFPVESKFLKKPLADKEYISHILQLVTDLVNKTDTSAIYGAGDAPPSDILVFLPSKRDIDTLCGQITRSTAFKRRVYCAALYSGLGPERELLATSPDAFRRQPGNPEVKIVLSTNIAETGVTVAGVMFVVDSGYEYSNTFDPVTRESTLQMQLIAKSSAKQRKGRAGRVAPGVCYHCYTHAQYDAMNDYQHAAISTSNIDTTVLKMLYLLEGKTPPGDTSRVLKFAPRVSDILAKLIEPPSHIRVKATLEYLQRLSVVDDANQLTKLGRCVYKSNVDIPLALFLIAVKRVEAETPADALPADFTQRAGLVAGIIATDTGTKDWFRQPFRGDPEFDARWKRFNSFRDKYSDIYGDPFAIAELVADFLEGKLKRMEQFINTKHILEAKRNAEQLQSLTFDCVGDLPQQPPAPKGVSKRAPLRKTTQQLLTYCLAYGYGMQIASRGKDGKYHIGDVAIGLRAMDGNLVNRLASEIMYFEIANILGNKRLVGVINVSE